MKKISMVVFSAFSLVSVSAFAGSLASIAKTVHSTSAGKMINLYGDPVYSVGSADGSLIADGDSSDSQTVVINQLCDLSKQWQVMKSVDSQGDPEVFCIAK
jgi:hypothetical protein